MRRKPFGSVTCSHRHVHAKAGTIEDQIQTFAIQQRNRCTRIRDGSADLDYFIRNGTGSLVCSEQKILLDRLSQYPRIPKGCDVVIGNAFLRSELERHRRFSRDTAKGKRLNQFQQSFFGIIARKTVKHFRSIQKTDADTVLGSGCRRFDLAGLQSQSRATRFFFKNFDKIRTGALTRLENFYRDRRIHSDTPAERHPKRPSASLDYFSRTGTPARRMASLIPGTV